MGAVRDVSNAAEFQSTVAAEANVAVFFWAQWSEPCSALADVVQEVASTSDALCFIRVEAEKVPEVTSHLEVTAVPTFVFLKNGAVADRLEGFDPEALFDKAAVLQGSGGAARALPLQERLQALVSQHKVMLFMKGSPDAPRCGFSSKVVAALQQAGVPFGHFDILKDDEVRQGLKAFSDWPTYPQLYCNGELVGGCDIILELARSGELLAELQGETAPAAAATDKPATDNGVKDVAVKADSTEQRIKALLGSSHVLLFMKGNPEAPRCGFSRRVVAALKALNTEFQHFDILEDDEIRQGLKKYSDWPTYPQLYVDSELVGGCDIVEEMHKTGELQTMLTPAAQ